MDEASAPDPRRSLAEAVGVAVSDWLRGAFLSGHVRIEHQIDEIIARYLAAPGRDLLLLSSLVADASTHRKVQTLKAILTHADVAKEFADLCADVERLARYRNVIAHGRGPLDQDQLVEAGGPADPAPGSFWFLRHHQGRVHFDEIDPETAQTLKDLLSALPARLDALAVRLAGD